jgi:hypothetical protein
LQPPPLEPMPFAAAAQKSATATQKSESAKSEFPKPAAPIVLPSATPKPSVIGPPKPGPKSASAVAVAEMKKTESESKSESDSKKDEIGKSGRPSYVDRDLLEFPLFMTELPKVKKSWKKEKKSAKC